MLLRRIRFVLICTFDFLYVIIRLKRLTFDDFSLLFPVSRLSSFVSRLSSLVSRLSLSLSCHFFAFRSGQTTGTRHHDANNLGDGVCLCSIRTSCRLWVCFLFSSSLTASRLFLSVSITSTLSICHPEVISSLFRLCSPHFLSFSSKILSDTKFCRCCTTPVTAQGDKFSLIYISYCLFNRELYLDIIYVNLYEPLLLSVSSQIFPLHDRSFHTRTW